MFSESGESSDEGPGGADEDSDVGEKELIRQEKLERARKRKRQEQRMTGFVTKKGLAAGKIGPERVKGDQLEKNQQKRAKVSAFQTPEVVRSSTRAHTVKNKKYVLQRLQEHEKRKASNPVHQRKAKESLTQAERIQRAKLIEERNVASLNEFFEQEVIRKKSQRAAMFAQRLIELGPFIRWRSVQVNLPAGQRRLIVEEIEHNEKHDGRKRAWRKHLTENDEEKLETIKPEKRKYNKKVKLNAGADADSAPDSNEKAIGNPPTKTTKIVDGIAGEAASSHTSTPLPALDTRAQDMTTPKTDVDNDRGYREDSQQTDLQEVAPNQPMSSPTKALDLSPSRELPATDTGTKSQDLTDPHANQMDSGMCAKGEDDHTNESLSIITQEDGHDSRAPSTGNMHNCVSDGLEKKGEELSAVESAFGDKNHSDGPLLQAGNIPLDDRLPTEETAPEATVLPVELAPCSTELVSLMDFHSDQKLDASTVRSVLLGPQASFGRAPARAKRHLCPITGGAVRFKDPLTGVCYSSLESFKVIRKVLSGAMPWNSAFGDGMYYGRDDDIPKLLISQLDENPVARSDAPAAPVDR
ncbi:YL1 nuclear protein-domain-containing protein [Lipomyces kononenkoae]|uniref:YL1 nuclear protein-domain-containing protein n=1 Tax=Lipomyces kononenkoae TaxID=34357 RepID=A0ACC3SQZ2_LIPKO